MLLLLRLLFRLGVGQEVGGHESALSAQLRQVEAVVVHVSEHVDDVSCLELEFNFRVDVGRELLGIVVVESNHLALVGGGVGVGPVRPVHEAVGAALPHVFFEHLVVVHLDLGHHVARNEPSPAVALTPVEAVGIFLANDL